jgi:hypothetical protein
MQLGQKLDGGMGLLRAAGRVPSFPSRRRNGFLGDTCVLALHELTFFVRSKTRVPGDFIGPLRHGLEQLESQQLRQEVAALTLVSGKEICKLSLRKNDRAGECVVVEPDYPLHEPVGTAHGVRPVAAADPVASFSPVQAYFGLTTSGRAPGDAIRAVADRKVEGDGHTRLTLTHELRRLVSYAFHFPIKRVGDRVENA